MSDPDYHTATVNGHSFRLRYLPGGVFEMGGEEEIGYWKNTPIHPVQLSPFYIGEYLVTQQLWTAVMGPDHKPSRLKGPRRPVERVSWKDIVAGNEDGDGTPAFLTRLNELTSATRPEGHYYRLPTEAEWEYAARANTSYLYAGSDKLKEIGWYNLNSHGMTQEVGLKLPNDFGLYDMSGNVWEWCNDIPSHTYYQECFNKGLVVNPTGPKEGHDRVLRGGGWNFDARGCRVSYRFNHHPTLRFSLIGFRLVLSPQSRESTSGHGGTE